MTSEYTANNPSLTYSEYMKKIDRLGDLIESEADEGEELTHITDKVANTFKEEGIYKMLLPSELGGAQLPWSEAMEVTERIAYHDGATGWCAMVGNVAAGDVGAFLGEEGVKETYEKIPNLLVGGQGVPNGKAKRVDGGYIINGDWNYGSGIYHADLVHSGCFVVDDEGKNVMLPSGVPEIVLTHYLPKDMELKHNWHVLGLKATGSYDYSSHDLFIPEKMCISFDASEPVRGGVKYSGGLIPLTTWGHTTFALGCTRRALDELAKLSTYKANPFGIMGDFPGFQEHFARAEAKYRSARAFCYEVWTDIDETNARGEGPSVKQLALVRLAMRHLHEVGSEITTFTHIRGGGVSLRESVLQRCFRDMHGGTQHILLSDQIMQGCGKVLSGRASKDAYWHMLGLIED